LVGRLYDIMMEYREGMTLDKNPKSDCIIGKMSCDDDDAPSPVAINQVEELEETGYITVNDSTQGPIFGSRACFDCTIDIGE
jgi:hypothetical protein